MNQKVSRKTFRTRYEGMIDTLRLEIQSNKYADGDFLPSENELSKQFRLSKNSVRKGLDVLVQEGLIEKKPRVGNVVVKQSVQEVVTIRFGYYPSLLEEADLMHLIDRFQKSYPSTRVKPLVLPYDDYERTVQHYFAHDLVDVISINYHDFLAVKETGGSAQFAPLQKQPHIYSFLTDVFTVDENLLVQPFVFSPLILCYNKDHFTEKGLAEPDSGWTWQQLRRVALQLKGENRCGFYAHLLSPNRWPVFLLQSLPTDGSPFVADERFMQRLNDAHQLVADNNPFALLLSESEADTIALFQDEKASVIMTTYFNINKLRNASFRYDISPLPFFDEPRTLTLAIGLAVNKESRHAGACKLFVDYLTSLEAQMLIRQRTLSIPAVKQAAEWNGATEVPHPSRYHMFREIIPTFHWIDELGLSSKLISRDMHTLLKLLWSHMISEEQFMREFLWLTE
ncbi:extracellular solute-binding protein [Numidum massiliense]|uniref:extracellular solute-binding protein n=1 Tax=Numidum massiliense TaxID=1522315 RepID=UPI0006D5B2B0|nr:extracellular solute-binding protein [Numidum massiliense]